MYIIYCDSKLQMAVANNLTKKGIYLDNNGDMSRKATENLGFEDKLLGIIKS